MFRSKTFPYTPTEEIAISWEWEGFVRPKIERSVSSIIGISIWVGGLRKSLPWGRHGYFLEIHISKDDLVTFIT